MHYFVFEANPHGFADGMFTLNIAEANGRFSPADRRRVFAIARGEAAEAAASVHFASISGLCAEEHAERVRRLGARTVALVSGLIRR